MRPLPVCLLAASALSAPTLGQACFDDPFEDNDDCLAAVPLAPFTYRNLNAGSYDSASAVFDPDCYSVLVPPDARLDVNAFFTLTSTCDLDLFVYTDPTCSGALVATGTSRTDNEFISWMNDGPFPVTAYIVAGNFFVDSCVDYELEIRVDFAQGCPIDDPYFPNFTCTTPAALLPGDYPDLAMLFDYDDYFAFRVPREARLTVHTDFYDALGNIDVELYNQYCGRLLDVSAGIGVDRETIRWRNNAPGQRTLSLRVLMMNASCNNYSLDVGIACPEDVFGIHDTCATALPLPIGRTEGLRISNLYESPGDSDVWSVTLAPDETLEVFLETDHAVNDVEAFLTSLHGSCDGGTAVAWASLVPGGLYLTWANNSSVPFDAALVVRDEDIFCYDCVAEACAAYEMTAGIGNDTTNGGIVCSGTVNSVGAGARIAAEGVTDPFQNDFTLGCYELPQGSFGYFLNSLGFGLVVRPGGSQGNLCIDNGAVGRYDRAGEILVSGANGSVSLLLDLANMPTPTGTVSVQVGEVWLFQYWYRDAFGASAVSNLSSAVMVSFR